MAAPVQLASLHLVQVGGYFLQAALCDCPLNTGIMFNVANLDCCLMLMTAYQAIFKYVWGVTMHSVFTLLAEEMIW